MKRYQQMQLKYAFIFFSSFLIPFFVFSQCPDKNEAWNTIVKIRDSEKDPEISVEKLLALKKQFTDCKDKDDSVYAYLLQRIGVYYFNLKEFADAVAFTRSAIDILQKNRAKESVNTTRLVNCYYTLALCFDSLELDNEKCKAIDSCMANSLRTDYGYEYSLYLWMDYVVEILGRGDYQRCLNNTDLGITLARKVSLKPYVFNFILTRANALISLKQYKEAESLLKSAANEFEKSEVGIYTGQLYEQLAELELESGKARESFAYFTKSLSRNRADNLNTGYQQTLTNMGYLYYYKYKKDYANALASYNKAIKILMSNENTGDYENAELLNLYANKAALYTEMNLPDSAIRYFQLAFERVKPDHNENISSPASIDAWVNFSRIDFIIPLIVDKADAYLNFFKKYQDRSYLIQAIKTYREADWVLTKIRNTHKEIYSKLFWRSETRRLYEHAIEACYILNDTEQAFVFFEKSKAILLADQLKGVEFLPNEDMVRLAHLRIKIRKLEADTDIISSGKSNSQETQKSLFQARNELIRLEEIVNKNTPLYYKMLTDTSIVSEKDVSDFLLKNNLSFAAFFNGDSIIYSLLITNGKTFLYRIPKSLFHSTVRRYNFYLSGSAKLNAEFNDYLKTASSLYQLIFQNHTIPPGKIIISPDGQYFPFEALVTSKTGEPVKYFIEDHAVSYTYSARFLMNDFYSNTTGAGKNFMGVAPVNYSSFSLSSLSGSDKSLKAVSNHFAGAVNFISSAATRNNFMQQFYKYKIIQLYTHASESSNNNEPVIYFADSVLYLSDLIGETRPVSKLIVLAACETGLGKDYKGEGVFSFNRGFAALGIPSSVTNLWTIDNESTYKLTELFYKYVAKGLALDEALQKAKLEFIKTSSKEKQLPYYWAAAILVGNTESIPIGKSKNWMLYATIAGIPAIAIILVLIAKRRRLLNQVPGTTGIAS